MLCAWHFPFLTMLRVNLFFFFLLVLSLDCVGQDDHLWIGSHLTEVIYSNGQWSLQREGYVVDILVDGDRYYSVPDAGKKYKRRINFAELDVQLDTIVLKEERTLHLFVKPEMFAAQEIPIKFKSFIYSIEDDFGQKEDKMFYLNRWKVFRVSNYKNETLLECTISDQDLQQFLDLTRGIDIRHMQDAEGTYNNCNDLDHTFVFVDTYNWQYSHTSIGIRRQFRPLRNFVLDLELKYGQ